MSQTPSSCAPIAVRHHPGSAIVSIQTGTGSLPSSVEVSPQESTSSAAAAGGTQNPSNIIIHEFLEEGANNGTDPSTSQAHHHHHHHHHVSHPGGGGSITIMTPPTPTSASTAVSRINICINNHYPSPPKPEPRRRHEQFKLSEDVLVRNDSDERLYLGTIIAIAEQCCLVRYDDGFERWSSFDEMTKLASSTGESAANGSGRNLPKKPLCVICKEHKPQQTVQVCDCCCRGYHRRCFETVNDSAARDTAQNGCEENAQPEAGPWLCNRCTTPVNSPPPRQPEPATNGSRAAGLADELAPLVNRAHLPYDPDGLEWDELHRVNSAGQYCYCGEDGDWMKEMIQCCWCEQWFHGRCIRSLQYPIFLGDPYYLFLCSICNHGHEFVRRVEMSNADLLHLVLYNLTVRNGPRLFSLPLAILPYLEDNLRTLQVPEQLAHMPAAARGEAMEQTLKNNRELFINGKVVGKSTNLWTLRTCEPPRKMSIEIPRGNTVTENLLKKLVSAGRLIRFLPRVYLEKNLVMDAVSRERMTGIKYNSAPFSQDDPREQSIVQDVVMQGFDSTVGEADALASANRTDGSRPWNNGRSGDVQTGDGTAPLVSISPEQATTSGRSVAANANGESSGVNDANGMAATGSRTNVAAQRTKDKRKYRCGHSQSWKKTLQAAYDSNHPATRMQCMIDPLFPPPSDYFGRNNPFHQDPDQAGPRPRERRIVNRRLSVNDLYNAGRTKKRKRNYDGSTVAGRMPAQAGSFNPTFHDALAPQLSAGPAPNYRRSAEPTPGPSGENSALQSRASSTTLVSPIKASKIIQQKPKTSAYQSRRLRPRSNTNYSEKRQYNRRHSQGGVHVDSGSGLELMDGSGECLTDYRPASSLSESSDSIVFTYPSSPRANGTGMEPVRQPQQMLDVEEEPQEEERVGEQRTWLRESHSTPWLQERGSVVTCIRTLRDGRTESLMEFK